MPCLAAVCQLPGAAGAAPGKPLVGLAGCCCWLLPGTRPARAQGVEVLDLKASRDEVAVSLDYQLRVALPAAVEEAVLRGVPLYFAAQASLWRPRWYWRDERVARVTREWRLSFQPLTSTWRVSQGGLGQSFRHAGRGAGRDDAQHRLAHCRRARCRRPTAATTSNSAGDWTPLSCRGRCRSALGGIGGASEWSLGVERSIKLASDTPK